jgi:hypothetical protein
MRSSKIQGELWGKAPRGWAEIQEPMHGPLWEVMLDAAEVGARGRASSMRVVAAAGQVSWQQNVGRRSVDLMRLKHFVSTMEVLSFNQTYSNMWLQLCEPKAHFLLVFPIVLLAGVRWLKSLNEFKGIDFENI